VVSGKRLFLYAYRLKLLACFGEFDLDRVLGGLGGPAQAETRWFWALQRVYVSTGSRRSSASIRSTEELRDGSIGSLALGHPFDPNPGSFRGREARHKQDLLETGIEKRAILESTRKRALR
jgi:hypothetical protein